MWVCKNSFSFVSFAYTHTYLHEQLICRTCYSCSCISPQARDETLRQDAHILAVQRLLVA
jgi:hypothetical protein